MIELPLSTYCCFTCGNPVTFHNDIVNTDFQGGWNKRRRRPVRAFLFYQAMNVSLGEEQTRQLLTGPHVVADVWCLCCKTVLGWKYQKAFADANKWKEGKVCLNMSKLC